MDLPQPAMSIKRLRPIRRMPQTSSATQAIARTNHPTNEDASWLPSRQAIGELADDGEYDLSPDHPEVTSWSFVGGAFWQWLPL
jgi:hypothetical protein